MVPKLNRTSIGILVVLAMLLALLGLEPGAAAAGLDKKGSADAKRATQLYKQGNYEEAAAVFLQLSVDNPGMPVFVRNLGACYYYLRRPDPALSNLREYLVKKKDVTPEDRAEVEGWIAEMDQLRQRGSTPAGAAVPPALPMAPPPPMPVAPTPPMPAPGGYAPLPPAQPPVAPAVMPETPPARFDVPPVQPQGPAGPAPYPPSPFAPAQYPPQYPAQYPPQYPAQYPAPATAPPSTLGPAATAEQVPPPPTESGSGRRTAAWVIGGVGVAGLLAGGVFTALAVLDFSDVETKYDPGMMCDGETFATLQWVGYGVGAAAIATAIILFATGKDTPPNSVVLAPTVGPGMAGAALSGRF
jgi:hypothetical protein